MSANLHSLPSTLINHIWDYCGANEIIAVASTCRMFQTEIESCMLVIDAKFDSLGRRHEIPIFFADHCHSVFLTYETYETYETSDNSSDSRYNSTKVVYSNLEYGDHSFVWQGRKYTTGEGCLYHVSFRNDPSRAYLLKDECSEWKFTTYMKLRKQFMTSAVTPAMKTALSACLNMGGYEKIYWNPLETDRFKQREMIRLFMKLFILGCETISRISSPIRTCFESGPKRVQVVDNPRVCLIPQITNLFEQTLEQKEPTDCVKRPLSAQEISEHPGTDTSQRNGRTYLFPPLHLNTNFRWERCNRRDFDHDEGTLFIDELVFVARIPLASNTARITLYGETRIDSPTSLFVIFFQKRQNELDDLKDPIEGEVFLEDAAFRTDCNNMSFVVKPEYKACFLYFVPAKATRMEMIRHDVFLEVVLDDHHANLGYWMRVLLRGCSEQTSATYRRVLPIILLRDGALALLGPDKEQNTELKEAFGMVGLDSTREGLECIVDVCHVLIRHTPSYL